MTRKRKEPSIADELLDELLSGTDALQAFESGDLVQDLKKALAERILNAEMDHHLDAEPEQAKGNHRNGHSRKNVITDDGKMDVAIPRVNGTHRCPLFGKIRCPLFGELSGFGLAG